MLLGTLENKRITVLNTSLIYNLRQLLSLRGSNPYLRLIEMVHFIGLIVSLGLPWLSPVDIQ